MRFPTKPLAGSLALAVLLSGCVSSSVPNAGGVPPIQVDPSQPGPVSGIGIEGHDIVAMTDQMMRDMLTEPALAARSVAPRVVIDSSNFRNEGSQPINRDLITNRLRVNLNRAAKGRMTFVNRTDLARIQEEMDLRQSGVVDAGTLGSGPVLGVDFRLSGAIASTEARSTRTGLTQRYNQITFEMYDMKGQIVWSGQYEFERAAADDVLYR